MRSYSTRGAGFNPEAHALSLAKALGHLPFPVRLFAYRQEGWESGTWTRAELEVHEPVCPEPPPSLTPGGHPPGGVIPVWVPTVTLCPGHRTCEQTRSKSSGYSSPAQQLKVWLRDVTALPTHPWLFFRSRHLKKMTEEYPTLSQGAEASLPLTGSASCSVPSILRKMWMRHKKKSEYVGATNSAFEAD